MKFILSHMNPLTMFLFVIFVIVFIRLLIFSMSFFYKALSAGLGRNLAGVICAVLIVLFFVILNMVFARHGIRVDDEEYGDIDEDIYYELEDDTYDELEDAEDEEDKMTSSSLEKTAREESLASKMHERDIEKNSFSKSNTGEVFEDIGNIKDGYYYKSFDDKKKVAYLTILEGILDRSESISLPDPLTKNEFSRVIYAIRFEHPELFYTGKKYSYSVNKEDLIVQYKPTYVIDKEDYHKMMKEVKDKYIEIEAACKNMGDFEKEVFVHDFIVDRCTYSLDTENTSNLYGALIEGEASCEGYSSAFSYIMNRLGIETIQVIGDPIIEGEMSHSWNMIRLGDDYYHIDLCWNDFKNKDKEFTHHSYFNLTEEEILKSRNMDKTREFLADPPPANSVEYNFYMRTGSFVENINEAVDLIDNELEIAVNTSGSIVLKCKDEFLRTVLLSDIEDIINASAFDRNLVFDDYHIIIVKDVNIVIINFN